MNKIKGFTVIELMIVVAIIMILIGISLPRFLLANCKEKCSKGECTEKCKEFLGQKDSLDYFNNYDLNKFCEREGISIGDFRKSDMLKNKFKIWVERGGI